MVKNPPTNAGDASLIPGSGRSPREWPPTPVFLPGKSHGQRNLAGSSPQGHKESDMTERLNNNNFNNKRKNCVNRKQSAK